MDPADPTSGFRFPPPLSGEELPALDAAHQGVLQLAKSLFRHPSDAMADLAAHPDRRWLPPLLALVAVSILGAVAAIPASRAYQEAVTRAQLARSTVPLPAGQSAEQLAQATTSGPLGLVVSGAAVVAGALGPVLALLLVAAVLHLLGTVLGGQQTYTQAFTLTAWARMPLAIGGLLWAAYVATGHFDPSPAGLSGLVAPDVAAGQTAGSLWQPVLGQIDLWNLWYLGLLAVGVRTASRVSAAKAVAVVLVLVLLEIGLGLAGVGVGRMFAGALG
jgi:hypothetical protein